MAYNQTVAIPAANSREHLSAIADIERDGFERTSEDSDGNRHVYRILDEVAIAVELQRFSHISIEVNSTSLSFQPAPVENQDRMLSLEWSISGRKWVFDCILDGNI
jgi:hypothetical protein